MWHASVAALDPNGRYLIPVQSLSLSNRRVLIKAAKMLISEVGQMPSSVEQMEIGIHYRRALTDGEYSELSPAWRAIPAVHEAGHGLVLEEGT